MMFSFFSKIVPLLAIEKISKLKNATRINQVSISQSWEKITHNHNSKSSLLVLSIFFDSFSELVREVQSDGNIDDRAVQGAYVPLSLGSIIRTTTKNS